MFLVIIAVLVLVAGIVAGITLSNKAKECYANVNKYKERHMEGSASEYAQSGNNYIRLSKIIPIAGLVLAIIFVILSTITDRIHRD